MKRRTLAAVLWTLAGMAVLGLAAAAAVVGGGVYDVASTTPHRQAVYSVLEVAMRQSVRRRAADIEPPPSLASPQLALRGAACFRDHCVQCHGAPGVAPEPFAQGLQPLPAPLVDAVRHWRARELYWITRHGIRMSGMPGWERRLPDEDLWALVAFMQELPALSPHRYAERLAQARTLSCPTGRPQALDRDLAQAGRLALRHHACIGCHTVPGVTGSQVAVGPTLEGFARQQLIAGRLPNTPDNLVRWLRDPQGVKPGTAMPAMGLDEADARAIAAYLATLY